MLAIRCQFRPRRVSILICISKSWATDHHVGKGAGADQSSSCGSLVVQHMKVVTRHLLAPIAVAGSEDSNMLHCYTIVGP